MKKIAVLGGTHFIGFHLISFLHEQFNEITIFNRGKTKPPAPLPDGVELVIGDRDNPGDYERLFCKDFDVVIDLSGFKLSHVEPIVCKYKSKIGHYIFCSTSSVYKTPPPYPLNEESPRTFIKNTYGGDKAYVEDLLLSEFKTNKWPITIFRPQGVFGAYDYFGQPTYQAWVIFYRLTHSLLIPAIGGKAFHFNLLYVDDLVKGFVMAMNNKVAYGNIYGISGDEPTSELDFINLCGQICSCEPKIHLVKNLAVKDFELVHRWPLFNLLTDNAKIKKDLNFKFTPLKTALEETCLWLEQNPDHFGPPSLRGENYILNNRPIPNSVKACWKICDKIKSILLGKI
jgi:nucleoside-diphosphate-sugar epimerase